RAGLGSVPCTAGQCLGQQAAGEAFLLAAAYPNPHPPVDNLAKKYLDMYAGVKFETFGYAPMAKNAAAHKEMFTDFLGSVRKCAASVTALDDQVAMLIERLRKKGLLEGTILILTSATGL